MIEIVKNLAADLATLREEVRGSRLHEFRLTEPTFTEPNTRVSISKDEANKVSSNPVRPMQNEKSIPKRQPNPDINKSNFILAASTLEGWTTVLGRKARKDVETKERGKEAAERCQQPQMRTPVMHNPDNVQRVRAPKRTVVTLTVASGSNNTYAQIMSATKKKINA